MARTKTNPPTGDRAARQGFSFRQNDPADNSLIQSRKTTFRPDPSPSSSPPDARPLLWQAGASDLHEAVDKLQADAVRDGLVAEIGQDEVQHILAEAFGGTMTVAPFPSANRVG